MAFFRDGSLFPCLPLMCLYQLRIVSLTVPCCPPSAFPPPDLSHNLVSIVDLENYACFHSSLEVIVRLKIPFCSLESGTSTVCVLRRTLPLQSSLHLSFAMTLSLPPPFVTCVLASLNYQISDSDKESLHQICAMSAMRL